MSDVGESSGASSVGAVFHGGWGTVVSDADDAFVLADDDGEVLAAAAGGEEGGE